MLVLTPEAADAIRDMVDTSADDTPSETGLRIATESSDSDGAELSIAVVDGPVAGDETVAGHGALVYLSSDAAELLSDKVLDAHAHDDHVHFTIGEQDGDEG